MRRLILPLLLVLCSSGCGGCAGDDNSSSGSGGGSVDNRGVTQPAIRAPLRPILQNLPRPSVQPSASAAPAAPSAPPPPAPSGSAVP